MPFNARSAAISFAVLCFFGVAVVGCVSGLSPFICCKRAVAAALFGYVVGSLVVKMINAIVIAAMVDSYINKRKGSGSDS